MNYVFDKETLRYVGSHEQLFGTKTYCLLEGKQHGVKAVDVYNGSGMSFTVLLDRGMDFLNLSYKGYNFSYLSNVGVSASQYYEKDGYNFFRTYTAGFLTTCGLTQVGVPNIDNEEEFGLHGRISHVPAEQVYSGTDWTNEGPEIVVCGKIKQAKFYGEYLLLERKIRCRPGNNKIHIHDKVTNFGYKSEPLMILYHINIGYPLLDEGSYVVATSNGTLPQNDITKSDPDWINVHKPLAGYKERVYLHNNTYQDENGFSYIGLINEKIEKGIIVKFENNKLDHLIQWKQLGDGNYVMGLEPSNCGIYGRHEAKKRGVIKMIDAGQSESFNLEIDVLEDISRINSYKKCLEKNKGDSKNG